MGHIHTESIRAAIRPEAKSLEEIVLDIEVIPIPIGLLGGEHVKIPLAGVTVRFGHSRPGWAAEGRAPLIRGKLTVFSLPLAEMEELALAATRACRNGSLEPLVIVRAMVRDDIDDELDLGGVQGLGHLVEIGKCADARIHVPIIVHVITAIGKMRRIERGEPHGVNAEASKVGDTGGDASQIADAIAVRIRERARVDLVDGCLAPPIG